MFLAENHAYVLVESPPVSPVGQRIQPVHPRYRLKTWSRSTHSRAVANIAKMGRQRS